MNVFLDILKSTLSQNSKAIGAAIGALIGQAIDPTVLGPIVTDPIWQTTLVSILSAAVGAWFAPKNK